MDGDPPEHYQPFPPFTGWCDDFDASVVDRYAESLAALRGSVRREALDRAVAVATRYAAVDTGAIEGLYATTRGFTRTIAEQTATWQAALAQRGEAVERSINDALNGYEMVLDLATGSAPLSESWIRRLHEVICASQASYSVHTAVGRQDQPLPKGSYKSMPNNPVSAETGRVFHYAPPTDTPAEMARMVDELRSATFTTAHPVLQAAYAHYAFVRIHPFADGNGRVARALASVFLYRRPGVPLVIFADQKDTYLDALEAADGGRPRSFVAYVSERTIDTIELVRLSLRSAAAIPADQGMSRLSTTLGAVPADPSFEAALTGERVLDRITEVVRARLDHITRPPHVTTGDSALAEPSESVPTGFRASRPARAFFLVLGWPLHHDERLTLDVWINESTTQQPALLVTGHPDSAPLELLTRDVVPVVSALGELKIENWTEEQVDLLVRDFERAVSTKLATDHSGG